MTKHGRRPGQSGRKDLGEGSVEAEARVRMRECNHRIKNHLQVLASLLAVQSRQSDEAPARQALLEACSRVAAVGRLHERLQETEPGDVIDVASFLTDLCADMRACFASDDAAGLKLDLDVKAARFPAEAVLPVGLIVSELVTNAVKYGGGADSCTVRVRLRKARANWRLTVADDGPGMDADPFQSRERMGSRLLMALARQLHGSIELDQTASGASVSVLFPLAAA